MKQIIMVVAVILAFVGSSGAKETFKGLSVGSYLKSRETGDASFEMTKSFINGVADGYGWANIDAEANWDKQFFCPPEHLAVFQDNYLEILDAYIEKNKSWLAEDTPIQPVMMRSLIETYPCENGQSQ